MDNERLNRIVQELKSEYKALAPYDWAVNDAGDREYFKGIQMEYFAPDSPQNPYPGRPTIEVYRGWEDTWPDDESIKKAIEGDMLHHLPENDPVWNELREGYRSSMTGEQKSVDQRAYKYYQNNWDEKRTFDDWFDQSRLDAHLRGYMYPDERDEWRGSYTPEQEFIFGRMKDYLKRGE